MTETGKSPIPNISQINDYSMNKHYQQAHYLLSVHQLNQLPPDNGIEVAFAGRSNAGKSSAINRICAQKSLAKTSRTPGRTQALNFFQVSTGKFIVDLPGYGFAKVGIKTKHRWQTELTRYLQSRNALKALVLVMDIRHPLQKADWFLIDLAFTHGSPIHILLTKCDKLSNSKRQSQLIAVKDELEQNGIQATLQLFSAQSGTGVEDVHSMLDNWFELPTSE